MFKHNVSGLTTWEGCLCVCACVRLREWAYVLSFFPPLWRLTCFFLIQTMLHLYPLSFQTPGWSIWPSFWISCCSLRSTQTAGTHTIHRQPCFRITHTHTWQYRPCKRIDRTCTKVFFKSFFILERTKKCIWRWKREERWRGERRARGGDKVWENGGGRGREDREGWNIIMCHSIWSWAKTCCECDLWWFLLNRLL